MPVHSSFIFGAEVNFSMNRASCVEFLRGCVRYGKTVVITCTAFESYSPFSRLGNSQDLVDRATRLGTERTEVSAEMAVETRGMRRFNTMHEKILSSLHRMDHELDTSFSCISAWVTELDAHSTFPAFNMKHLRRLSRIWVKNRDAIADMFAALPPLE